jgi:hypothetical protein
MGNFLTFHPQYSTVAPFVKPDPHPWPLPVHGEGVPPGSRRRARLHRMPGATVSLHRRGRRERRDIPPGITGVAPVVGAQRRCAPTVCRHVAPVLRRGDPPGRPYRLSAVQTARVGGVSISLTPQPPSPDAAGAGESAPAPTPGRGHLCARGVLGGTQRQGRLPSRQGAARRAAPFHAATPLPWWPDPGRSLPGGGKKGWKGGQGGQKMGR